MNGTFRLSYFGFASVLALSSLGCGTAERHVCERVAECSDFDDDWVDTCTDNLQDAVRDDEIGKDDVRECRDCLEDNSCGLDLVIDCANDCAAVPIRGN